MKTSKTRSKQRKKAASPTPVSKKSGEETTAIAVTPENVAPMSAAHIERVNAELLTTRRAEWQAKAALYADVLADPNTSEPLYRVISDEVMEGWDNAGGIFNPALLRVALPLAYEWGVFGGKSSDEPSGVIGQDIHRLYRNLAEAIVAVIQHPSTPNIVTEHLAEAVNEIGNATFAFDVEAKKEVRDVLAFVANKIADRKEAAKS